MLLGDLGGLLACEAEAAGTGGLRPLVAACQALPCAGALPSTSGMFSAASPPWASLRECRCANKR